MLPRHALNVKSLVRARTLGGAYQMQNERETGSIEVAQRANVVVIDQEILEIPPASIHETRVLMTFFAMASAYEKAAGLPRPPSIRLESD